jgi:hypothetical protein
MYEFHLPTMDVLIEIFSAFSPLLLFLPSLGQIDGCDLLEPLELGLWPRILVINKEQEKPFDFSCLFSGNIFYLGLCTHSCDLVIMEPFFQLLW